MSENAPDGRVVRFGVFEADLRSGELRKSGVRIRLRDQAFQVLTELLERPGEVVTREELRDRLWPDGTFVDFDHSLNAAVNSIREVLGDSAASPRFVETLPRRGYRFIAPVEKLSKTAARLRHGSESRAPRAEAVSAPETTPPETTKPENPASHSTSEHTPPEKPKRHFQPVYLALAVALLALIAVLGYFGLQNRYEPDTAGQKSGMAAERPSIAVLPLENVGGGEENEYFSEGVTDDIISHLSKISGLKVISRTSSGQYKNTDKGLRQIADELGVSSVLEGSVRRSGDRVRIVTQLVDAGTDETLWSATYDRDLIDIFGIQSEVAQTIARALEAELTPAEIARLEEGGTANLKAYQLVLAGRYQINKLTMESWRNALDSFQRAVELDPNYAFAYVGLALCYERLGQDEEAKQATMRALELNDRLAESHVALGRLRLREWDWPAAEQALTHALALDPNLADAHHEYAHYLSITGRTQQAVEEARRARELDPLTLLRTAFVGWTLHADRQWDAAIAEFRYATELDPRFGEAWRGLAAPLIGKGMYAAAVEAMQTSVAVGGGNIALGPQPTLAYAYARAGNISEARDVLDQFKAQTGQMEPGYRALGLALIHAGLGEKDQAFAWLDRAADERYLSLPVWHQAPPFDDLRSDPRYRKLQKRMGLER